MEGAYFFGEHLRWNLGWSNPNQAGLFVAMWIPFAWSLGGGGRGSSRFVPWWGLVLEIGLWFLLCKTYSRGALMAVAAGACQYLFLSNFAGARSVSVRVAVTRFAAVALMLAGTGFLSRVAPLYVSQDASATNRLTLWKAGLEMIAVSPWGGWGPGKSGENFMHWFQPVDSSSVYAGMVNSYLHVGVERGVVVLGVVLTLGLGLIIFSWKRLRSDRMEIRDLFQRIGWAASASVVVFLVANIFSTLWIFPRLWWLPISAATWVIFAAMHSRGDSPFKTAAISWVAGFMISTAIVGLMYFTGSKLQSGVHVSRETGGDINCTVSSLASAQQVWVLPDSTVLGDAWGKEVRRLALANPSFSFRVPSQSPKGEVPCAIIACGGRVAEAIAIRDRFGSAPMALVLVHPLGKPPSVEQKHERVLLVVPTFDTAGVQRRWRTEARKHGWECVVSRGVGQDARLVWPDVLSGLLGDR